MSEHPMKRPVSDFCKDCDHMKRCERQDRCWALDEPLPVSVAPAETPKTTWQDCFGAPDYEQELAALRAERDRLASSLSRLREQINTQEDSVLGDPDGTHRPWQLAYSEALRWVLSLLPSPPDTTETTR